LILQICSSKVSSADNTVVAPFNSVAMLTMVETMPWLCCELLIASNRILAVEGHART
jgi:hypothetical protein